MKTKECYGPTGKCQRDVPCRHACDLRVQRAATARVGDKVQCDLRLPTPRTITMVLETPEAAAHANQLLADETSGWRLVDELHPLAGSHINQGSMDAAADAYEAEYNAVHNA